MTFTATGNGHTGTGATAPDACVALAAADPAKLSGGPWSDYGGSSVSLATTQCVYYADVGGTSTPIYGVISEDSAEPPSGGASGAGPSADFVAASASIWVAFMACFAVVWGLKKIAAMLFQTNGE